MKLKIDKKGSMPVGIQIKEQIKMHINSGALKAGEKLPSINELAAILGVNKNTIVSVLKDLDKEGYVESYRGKGVFVNSGKTDIIFDGGFINDIDLLIKGAKDRKIGVNELLSLINSRYSGQSSAGKVKALFLCGISQKIVDINVGKLQESIPELDARGIMLSQKLSREKMLDSFNWADIFVIPSGTYAQIKKFLPKDKPVIRTVPEFKIFNSLKKGVEKKSKICVMAASDREAKALADLFVSEGLFRPKLVISVYDRDKLKKELKEIDSFVICGSIKEVAERLKLKEKNIYYFSDYIADESIKEIRNFAAAD